MTAQPAVDWTQWSLSYLGDLYGSLYGGHSVTIAVTNTLKLWLPAYVEEMNRNLGSSILSIPKNYEFRPEYTPAPPQPNRPQVLVDCSGTAMPPVRRSDGIQSVWKVQIGVWLYGGQDWREVQALTYAYLAAIRAVLLQQSGLGGFADSVQWVGENYGEREHTATRTIGQGFSEYNVSVLNTMQQFAGPTIASLDPPAPLPTVEQVDITVNNEEADI